MRSLCLVVVVATACATEQKAAVEAAPDVAKQEAIPATQTTQSCEINTECGANQECIEGMCQVQKTLVLSPYDQ